MLSRRSFLAATTASVVAAQSTNPNLIVIFTDDQGIGDLGCYGHPEVKTPNLDALAASGIRFTNWYSTCPVCSPSRASLLTGKYPENHGIRVALTGTAKFDQPALRANEVSLARELKKLNYRTAHIGKWHMGSAAHSRPAAHGYDEFFGFFSGWTDYYSHRYYTLGKGDSEVMHDLWRNDTEVWADNQYQTELLGQEALAFLSRQSKSTPFYLNLSFGAPHYPMTAPDKYLARIPSNLDRDRRLHLAMILAIDDQIGLLIARLKKLGLYNNTLIYFQSDNGATSETRADHAGRFYRGGSNDPFRGYKQGLFEGGIRVPTLLSWPARIAPRQTRDGVGMAADVLPSFLSLLKAPIPAGIDGKDQSALWLNSAPSAHDHLRWYFQNQSAVRRGKWKLILNPPAFDGPNPGPLWLSNLEEDPAETRNYAPDNPLIVSELRKLLNPI
jgi:arylsulfatase A-like enzyme